MPPLQILACSHPGAVVGLRLAGLGLDGILPDSLADLHLQFLDVRHNPDLHGVIPPGIASESLLGLRTSNTSLNCHNDTLQGKDLVDFAVRLHKSQENNSTAVTQWAPGEQACVDVLHRKLPGWQIDEPVGGAMCQRSFFPNSHALLSAQYVLGIGCTCPATTKLIFLSDPQQWILKLFCQEFMYMWMVELLSFTLMLLYLSGVAYRLADKHKAAFTRVVKLYLPPGRVHVEANVRACPFLHVVCQHYKCISHQHKCCPIQRVFVQCMLISLSPFAHDVPVMQSISWSEGLFSLLRAALRVTNAGGKHPCFVAMTVVKDWPELVQHLTSEQANSVLEAYRRALLMDLGEFSGWVLACGDVQHDETLFLCAFHEIADAAAWGMRTQHALLNIGWPAVLNNFECSRMIHHRKGGHWQRLFAGLRPSTAINKQIFSSMTRGVCIFCSQCSAYQPETLTSSFTSSQAVVEALM